MKFIISAILAAVLCLFRVQAVAQDFDSQMSTIFQNVDKSQVSTGFLKDYGFEFLNPDLYTGNVLHDSNYVGLQDWRMLYATLLSCQVNTQASPVSLSSVNSMINTYNYGNMPLTFVSMDFDYDRLRDDALSASLMYVSNDQLYDVAGRTESPYETESMFAIAPTHQQVLQGSNQIIFRPELFYSNNGKTVSDIAYNIGGGSSYTSIGFNNAASVTFANTGWYTMNIRVTYTDNTIRYGHTKVLVFSNPSYGSGSARFGPFSNTVLQLPDDPIIATEAFQGVAGRVRLNIQLSVKNSSGTIQRPLIIVEGFDPRNDMGVDDFDRSMNVNASGYTNTLNEQLDDIESYDLIFVNYVNGTDFIQRNALALEAAINWVNGHKTPFFGVRQQNVIIGQSMGGLVTRWALRDMELDGVAHETRLFISHDAPHWGANVPASAQLGVQYLSTWRVINPNSISGWPPTWTYSDMFPQVNEGMAMFTSPAARQMLIKRYVLNGNGYVEENSWHDAFMNELNGMGWPANSKNILVSNGACNGTKQFADNSNFLTLGGTSGSLSYLQIVGTGFFSALFGALNSTGIVFAGGNPQFNNWALLIDYPLSLITTKKTYTMDFRLNAVPSSGTGELFRAQIYNDRKILWVINSRSYILNKVYHSFSGMLPLDNAPGGQFDFEARLNMNLDQITAGLPNFLDFIQPAINQRRFCFVPTVSALAFNDPVSNLTASFCNTVPCLQTGSAADYYASTVNEEHIEFTSGNAGWLLQRQNPAFSCARVCPTALSISGDSRVCNTSIYTLNNVPSNATVNWSLSNAYGTLTTNGNTATFKRVYEGRTTLTASVTGSCGTDPIVLTKDIVTELSPQNNSIIGGINEGQAFCIGTRFNVYTTLTTTDPPNWVVLGGTIEYTASPQFIYITLDTSPGGFAIMVNYIDECGNVRTSQRSGQIIYDGVCTGTPVETRMQTNPVTVFPNPASSQVTIIMNRGNAIINNSADDKIKAIKIYDVTGRLRKQQKYNNATNVTINVSDLLSGIYFVEIISNHGSIRKNLNIKR